VAEDGYPYPDTTTDGPWDVSVDDVGAMDAPEVDPAPDRLDALDAPDPGDATDALDAPDGADAADLVEEEPCGDAWCAAHESCCLLRCTDTDTDLMNCGSCSNACNTDKSDNCSGGVCMCGSRSECASSSWMKCCTPDGCVDTYHSDEHCGACNNECWFDEYCDFGWCTTY
jgi:hypothetical protein